MKEKILFLIRILIGGLFIYSGYVKLIEPYQNFLAIIYSYKILGGWPAHAAALVIPWVEFCFGLFLLKGLWIRFSAGVLWLLNGAFILVVAQAMIRRIPLEDCGCFGDGAVSLELYQVLILDLALWCILAVLFFKSHSAGWWSIDRFYEKK